MPDSVFTYRMPAGVPGECSRLGVLGTTIKPEIQNASTPVTAYGQVVTVDSNGVRPLAAGDTAAPATPLGVSIRPFPSSDYTFASPSYGGANSVAFGAGTPPTSGVVDVMRRGYVTVKLNGAAAATKGGLVYAYYNVSTGLHVQSGVEAAAGANLWVIPGWFFTGAADAAGNTEIEVNL